MTGVKRLGFSVPKVLEMASHFWREEGRTCLKSVLERLIDLGLVTFAVQKRENFKVGWRCVFHCRMFGFYPCYTASKKRLERYFLRGNERHNMPDQPLFFATVCDRISTSLYGCAWLKTNTIPYNPPVETALRRSFF